MQPGHERYCFVVFFSSRRRHTRSDRDWSSDVCSSDLRYFNPEALKYLNRLSDHLFVLRSEERRVGKSVDLGGRRIIKKKKKNTKETPHGRSGSSATVDGSEALCTSD